MYTAYEMFYLYLQQTFARRGPSEILGSNMTPTETPDIFVRR